MYKQANMTDTSICESEPIRFSGAILPHGALLVLSSSGLIEAASMSCDTLLDIHAKPTNPPPLFMLGERVKKMLGLLAGGMQSSGIAASCPFRQNHYRSR
jgi:light-regulated signal transduction histidine kinase (bacteriophytochrome)